MRNPKIKLLSYIFFGLITTLNAYAADWKVVDSISGDGELLVDSESIKKKGEVTSLVWMQSYAKYSFGMQSMSYETEINCTKKQSRTFNVYTYKSARGEGLTKTSSSDAVWSSIKDSKSDLIKKVYAEVCNAPLSSVDLSLDSKKPVAKKADDEIEMNASNCNKLTAILNIHTQQASSAIGVPESSMSLIGPIWGSSVDQCFVMYSTPLGPHRCVLSGLQKRQGQIVGWGFGYNCQKVR
jgi:hypothetical protein